MKKQSEHLFKIGEIAKILGVTRKAILVYEEMGLLTPAVKDEASGYRYYTADNMTQIRAIRSLQTLGLSLAEIREYYYDTENLGPQHPSASIARGKTGRLKRAPRPPASAGVFLPQIPVYRCEGRRHQIAGYLYCRSQNRKNVHGEPHVYCTCRFLLQGTRSAMLHPCFRRFCG